MSDNVLDFDARPADVAGAHLGAGPSNAPASPTCLKVDRWGMRRATDIATRWAAESDMPDTGENHAVLADAHEALFAPEPAIAERAQDASRAAWLSQMMATPEYQALHSQTMLDPMLSEIAAAQVCREWEAYAADQPEQQQGAGKPAPGSDDEPIGQQIARIRSTARAMQQAADDVQTSQETAAGLGMGEGATLPPEQMSAYFRRVRDNPTLRAIMQMAGRMTSLCRSLQRTKVDAERGEITGLELGGDVSRLISRDLAMVAGAVPELELLSLYRLATRRLLCYRHRRLDQQAMGPIVVSVDESASMSGERITAAKGLALALAWLAHHQRRHIMLSGFSGDAEATCYIAAPSHHDQTALMDWLSHMWNGGTTLDAPLATVPSWWSDMPKGKTDHIIITDAEVDLPDTLRDSYHAWAKTEQVRTYGIVIGCPNPGPLAAVCNRVWALPNLDLESAAISEVLSL